MRASAEELREDVQPDADYAATGWHSAFDHAASTLTRDRGKLKAAAVTVIITADPDPSSGHPEFRCGAI